MNYIYATIHILFGVYLELISEGYNIKNNIDSLGALSPICT